MKFVALVAATPFVALAHAGIAMAQVAPADATPTAPPPAAPAKSGASAPPADQNGIPSGSGATGGGALGDIIVTARRQDENLQRVPVAVTVLDQKTFQATGAYRPETLQTSVPGLAVASNISDRNNITYTIRGQGNTYGTLFPSVITYFQDVPVTQLSVGQFFDLSSVQVLRGPQGVQFGRVTDGGNVMLTVQRPTSTYSADISIKAGNYGLLGTSGFANVPLSGDVLAVRFAWDVARRKGFTKNLYNNVDLDNENYQTVRLGVLFKPSDGFENYTVAQYQHLRTNGTSGVLNAVNTDGVLNTTSGLFAGFAGLYDLNGIGDVVPAGQGVAPLTAANYAASLVRQVALQKQIGVRKVFESAPLSGKEDNLYIVNTTTVHLSDAIDFTNIFGYVRVKNNSMTSYTGGTGSYVASCQNACAGDPSKISFIDQQQLSNEARLSGKIFGDSLTWSIGAYFDKQQPGGLTENNNINLGLLKSDVIQRATTTSSAGYAYAEYDASKIVPGLKVNGGVRYTHDTVDSFNVNYLAPVSTPILAGAFAPFPHGQCTTYVGLAGPVTCKEFKASFNAFTWTGGVSYQIAPNDLVYAKISKGYRPGGVNSSFPPSDLSASTYKPEYDRSIEIGLKSQFSLAGLPTRFNIAAYRDNYTSIQQNVSVISDNNINSFISNVAKATVQGVEVEGTIAPTAGMTIGAHYAYTDASFDKDQAYIAAHPTACSSTAAAAIGFCLYNRFVDTPKHQFGVNFNYDFVRDSNAGTFGFGGNFYHQSSAAISSSADSAKSPSGIEPAYSTVDLNASWTKIFGQPLDLTIFVTNVTNKVYRVMANSENYAGSLGVETDSYAPPRMFGATLTAHLR